MSSDLAIKVDNVSKCYQIYDTPRARLKQFVLPRLHHALGLSRPQYFREFWALRDVSFDVKKGETVGIIGRNGSGKSTLLQMICGTLNPTSGSIQAHGRIAALLELGSGFNPEFTGRENVYMNAAILGVSKDEIDARFDDIAAFADIGHFLDQPVKSYSSGMVVRLAFAVQAMIEPDILVVDEALAVGDEKFQRKCFARLEELKAQGTSVLFVSHSAASILELCDRALFLEHGARLMYGAPQTAIRAYQKLIYAPADDYRKLVDDLLAVETGSPVVEEIKPGAELPVAPPEASYDAGLVPDTMTVYPVQGAKIEAITIRDAAGHVVNVLKAGGVYQFEMQGRFLTDFDRIFVALHVRNVSGTVITGQRTPGEGRYFENLRAGSTFVARFSFNLTVLPGVYFVGGGIWSAGEPSCAHRILDALMFRVAPAEAPISFGYVDMMSEQPFMKLSENDE